MKNILPLSMVALLFGAQACPAHAPVSATSVKIAADAVSSGSDKQAADGTAPTSASPPADGNAPTSASPAAKPPLQGGVQKVELNLEKLRDVGLDLKHTLKALSSLYDEVSIQPVTLITEPEVIGRGIIINIPIGTQPVGPRQPARKDRVDLEMSAIKPEISLLKQNVDDFLSGHKQIDLPEDVLNELQPQTKKWTETVNTLSTQLAQLNQLTQGPPYDQDSIAALSVDMQKQVKSLDETRRKIYKVIRKEGKRIASERKESSGT